MTRLANGLLGLIFAALLELASSPAIAADPAWPAPLAAAFADAKASMMANPAEALAHVAKAEAIARAMPAGRQQTLAHATALWLGAEANIRSNHADRAGPMLTRGLELIAPIAEPIKLRGDLMMSRGNWYMDADKAAAALESYQQAYRIFAQVHEPRSEAVALQNIALLYYAANDNDRAEHYLAQAAAAYSGDPALSLSLHNNRGNVLSVLMRFADAEAEYAKAIAVARSTGDPMLEARVIINLARSQLEQEKYNAATQSLSHGFTLIESTDAPMLRRQLLGTKARLAFARGDRDNAVRLIRQAFDGVDLTKTTGDYRNMHVYAHDIFRAVGESKLALEHLEALKRLNDESAKVATTTGAALMAARFDYANQELRIANLKAEELRRSAAYQRTLFLSIGAGTLVIIALLSVALLVIRRSRNQVRASNVVLGDTNAALEKALRAKTEFLATTSHEIRTPLNGILGMTQVMLRDRKLDAETRDRIGIVHGAGVTMRSLVDDILDVAKIENGNLTVDPAPMDLCATLREVTRMWEEHARAKGIAFSLNLDTAPRWIVSDAGRLRQVVFNLLSNAIKFTEKGGVSVRAVAEGEGEARRLKLCVADTGIGIPAEKRGEIFESFKQADSGTTRKFGGTGLGLTICRNLAQALGGDISVESAEGLGSTFIVELPLVEVEAPAAEPSRPGGTMLILDRNPIARAMLKTLLEPRVGMLRFAATPDEARTALAEAETPLLLVDEATLKAAGDDPFDVLRDLAAAAAAAGGRSAILWLKPDADTQEKLKAVKVDQVVEKPIGGGALIAALGLGDEKKTDTSNTGPLVSRAA